MAGRNQPTASRAPAAAGLARIVHVADVSDSYLLSTTRKIVSLSSTYRYGDLRSIILVNSRDMSNQVNIISKSRFIVWQNETHCQGRS